MDFDINVVAEDAHQSMTITWRKLKDADPVEPVTTRLEQVRLDDGATTCLVRERQPGAGQGDAKTDRRVRVRTLKEARPDMSVRAIAEATGASKSEVSRILSARF